MTDLSIKLDRAATSSLAEQLRLSIETAILDGRLAPGARLPSWRDLATRLGVARGTVRVAYERLSDAQLIVAAGPAGTRVTEHLPTRPQAPKTARRPALPIMFLGYSTPPRIFQMGVPAQDAFPFKTWSRTLARAARQVAASPVSYPDPRGEQALRRQLAGYLAVGRSMACSEDQVFITGGYNGALGLVAHVLQLRGKRGWMEEPGYPIARAALRVAGAIPLAVPVDGDGLDVSRGIKIAADAAFALVTPGQQAPLGMTLSLSRRRALLQWAEQAGAFVIEDDYLSELQLNGRAAPALASIDHGGRVIHIGTFSKTISPTLRLGFVVAPAAIASRFAEAAAYLAPAPFAGIQHAVAEFLEDGHYMRHLRKMKRLYAQRRDLLKRLMEPGQPVEAMAGLALVLRLAAGTPDVEIAKRALALGLAPGPLSPWYADQDAAVSGLLLGITNLAPERIEASWAALQSVIAEFS